MQVFRILAVLWSLFLVAIPALALEGAETTHEWEGELAVGESLRVENLLGTVHLVAGSSENGVRVTARVAAEAKSSEEALDWANSVELLNSRSGKETLIHIAFPTDRSQSFRPPKSGLKGLWSRWSASMLRESSSVEYDGALVQLGSDRKATGLAVELTIELPYDRRVIVSQGAGSVHGRALRGDFDLTTQDGNIELDRCFGSAAVRNTRGEIAIWGFQGQTLRLVTDLGKTSLEEVRAKQIELISGSGSIGGAAVQSDSLIVQSESGDIGFSGVESATFEIQTTSADVDVATHVKRLTQASIQSATGDITLRVGGLTHFDLAATTRSGEIKMMGLKLESLGAESGVLQYRRGRGGPDIEARAAGGTVTVRPYDASRLSLMLKDSPYRR